MSDFRIDPGKTALIIQDLQNDVLSDGGAWAESGAPDHARSQNIVENVANLAAEARDLGMPVVHVHYIVEPGAAGLKQNAPLFRNVREVDALVRGTWGAAPVEGLAHDLQGPRSICPQSGGRGYPGPEGWSPDDHVGHLIVDGDQ